MAKMEDAHRYYTHIIFSVWEHSLNDACLRTAFSHREGIALSTITYNDNGEVRPIFYRLSLAEMVVPYAAPEFPHPRKFAFDVYVFQHQSFMFMILNCHTSGEYGMGTMANELSLGCDCLGQIHYLVSPVTVYQPPNP
jgi:primary-amine oxidase